MKIIRSCNFYCTRAVIIKTFLLLFTGGAGYYLIELLYRGYSHFSMAICGGMCFFLIYFSDLRFSHKNILFKSLVGAVIITVIEFFTGCIVNMVLRLNVWDYSSVPLNLFGQICLPYSFLWFLLCFPIDLLCRIYREKVFTVPLLCKGK